jgi:hypothetical protein
MGRQYERVHSTTIQVPDDAEGKANRFIGADGYYADGTSLIKCSRGISIDEKDQGVINVVTYYSGVIELAEAVDPCDFIKPAADGSGRGAKGSATEHCAQVISAKKGGAVGDFIEVIILPHVTP